VDSNVDNITSRSNPICVHFKKLGAGKSYRDEHGEFICDGEKLLKEALEAGIQINKILTSKCINFTLPDTARVYNAKSDLIDSLSPLKTSQGLLFTCKTPQPLDVDYSSGTHILLDGIQDPGNVGAIIRTACAFDIESVILTEGCADLYNLKTIRASMGAVFRQKASILSFDQINQLNQAGIKFIAAMNSIDATDIMNIDMQNAIIILGNEGRGISEKLLALCAGSLNIPISANCESLNVAAAAVIIIWEARNGKCHH